MNMSDTPAVEMLWEDVEPGDALMSRFGFADSREASDWILEVTRLRWGLDVQSCERITISDRNALAWLDGPSGSMVAKWSTAEEKFERLDAIARVVEWLGQRGVAVSAPIAATDGRVQVEESGVSLAMQWMIRGGVLDADSPDQVRAAGAMLARMHVELAAYPETSVITGLAGQPGCLRGTIRNWLDADRDHVPDAVLSELQNAIGAGPDGEPPAQLLHGDFRSTNILWSGSEISGVLDFDEARVGPRVDEIARSSVLLGTAYREWGPVTREVRTALFEGYESVSPLTNAESLWLPVLVLWYSAAMIQPNEDRARWTQAALEQLKSPSWTS